MLATLSTNATSVPAHPSSGLRHQRERGLHATGGRGDPRSTSGQGRSGGGECRDDSSPGPGSEEGWGLGKGRPRGVGAANSNVLWWNQCGLRSSDACTGTKGQDGRR